MPPAKPPVPPAVLAALGLLACEPTDKVTPCLSIGPCLDYAESGTETDPPVDTFGPCLDIIIDTHPETDLPDTDAETDTDGFLDSWDSVYDTSGNTGDTGVTPCLDFPVDTDALGPCLDFPVDTAETDIGPCLSPPVDTFGPCLDFPADTSPDTDIGPCLSPPAPTPPPAPPPPQDNSDASANEGRKGAIRRVLHELPTDLQDALRGILDDGSDA